LTLANDDTEHRWADAALNVALMQIRCAEETLARMPEAYVPDGVRGDLENVRARLSSRIGQYQHILD
jgi:hypothetical protein